MFPTRFKARLAAATLAAALALAGVVGVGAAGADHHDGDPTTDEVAATWSFPNPGGGGGWGGTNGATWS